MGGGLKGTGCRWLWGMKSLNNKSHWASTFQLGMKKKISSTLRLSWGVSGESQVRHRCWHARGCVCGQWAVIKCGPHRHHTVCAICEGGHTYKIHTHATRVHTNTHFPITILFAPYPLPLTLPHPHKMWLNLSIFDYLSPVTNLSTHTLCLFRGSTFFSVAVSL